MLRSFALATVLCQTSFLFVVRAIRVKFAFCLLKTNVRLCESGGIGRRAGFRFQWGNP